MPFGFFSKGNKSDKSDKNDKGDKGDNGVEVSMALDRRNAAYMQGDTIQATVTVSARKAVQVHSIKAGLVYVQAYVAVEKHRNYDYDQFSGQSTVSVSVTADPEHHVTWVNDKQLSGVEEIPAEGSHTYEISCPVPTSLAPTCSGPDLTE